MSERFKARKRPVLGSRTMAVATCLCGRRGWDGRGGGVGGRVVVGGEDEEVGVADMARMGDDDDDMKDDEKNMKPEQVEEVPKEDWDDDRKWKPRASGRKQRTTTRRTN